MVIVWHGCDSKLDVNALLCTIHAPFDYSAGMSEYEIQNTRKKLTGSRSEVISRNAMNF